MTSLGLIVREFPHNYYLAPNLDISSLGLIVREFLYNSKGVAIPSEIGNRGGIVKENGF